MPNNAYRSDLIDLELTIIAMTPLAVAVKNDRAVTVWLPRSQIEIDGDPIPGQPTTITMPEWLAEDRELS